MARELARADLKFKVAEYYALVLMSTVVLGLGAWAIQGNPISILIGGIVGFFAPRFYVKQQQSAMIRKFDDQLGDMLNLRTNGLRAGYSTMQALEAVGRELPSPICDEFRRVVQEMQIGIPMEKALDNLLRRIPSEDLDFVITAINVQRDVVRHEVALVEVHEIVARQRPQRRLRAASWHAVGVKAEDQSGR